MCATHQVSKCHDTISACAVSFQSYLYASYRCLFLPEASVTGWRSPCFHTQRREVLQPAQTWILSTPKGQKTVEKNQMVMVVRHIHKSSNSRIHQERRHKLTHDFRFANERTQHIIPLFHHHFPDLKTPPTLRPQAHDSQHSANQLIFQQMLTSEPCCQRCRQRCWIQVHRLLHIQPSYWNSHVYRQQTEHEMQNRWRTCRHHSWPRDVVSMC